MTTFSERHGYKPDRTRLHQFESMDDRLRNALWNFLLKYYFNHSMPPDFQLTVLQEFWTNVIGQRSDEFSSGSVYGAVDALKNWYLMADWHEVYDILEHVLHMYGPEFLVEELNAILGREGSAYRFVGNVIAPITNDEELAQVESATQHSYLFHGASQQIMQAVTLLGNRDNPDFRNAIKESISAVESAVKVASGQANFEKGLQKFALHPQLRQGWTNIYNWTSNDEGIRHGLTREPLNAGLAEARYMVVACSAFVNYLVAKHSESSSQTH